MKLLKHEIVKSLVFYIVFRPSSTSGSRVVIGDEEATIFRDATLPPVWMVAFVLATVSRLFSLKSYLLTTIALH